MASSKRSDIDPAVRRALGESVAHNSEARRLTAELAKSRGAPVPDAPPPSTDFEEELITAQHDIAELQKAARGPMPSQPEASVRAGPVHLRIANAPAWMLMGTLIILGALGAFAYIAAHAAPESVPVLAQPKAPRPAPTVEALKLTGPAVAD